MNDDNRQTIRAFLALPPEALPAARVVHDEDGTGSVWSALRDRAADRPPRYGYPVEILLTADRPEWRNGSTVTA
jgi:hypothetical protein